MAPGSVCFSTCNLINKIMIYIGLDLSAACVKSARNLEQFDVDKHIWQFSQYTIDSTECVHAV